MNDPAVEVQQCRGNLLENDYCICKSKGAPIWSRCWRSDFSARGITSAQLSSVWPLSIIGTTLRTLPIRLRQGAHH